MKETILDVLLYLFEHYLYDEDATQEVQDRDRLQKELICAGFGQNEINRTFDWLEALDANRPTSRSLTCHTPIRVFYGPELARLDVEARGFLLFLEQHGVLDGQQREWVLERAMALDQETIALDDLKWVILMALFNQPDQEAAYAWMETQIFSDDPEPLH